MTSIEKDLVKSIIEKIVQKRQERGCSLENVANELGISASAYHKIERQASKLSVERLFQLVDIFKVDVSEFLDISSKTAYYQHVSEQATAYQQNTLYQENMKVMQQYVQALKEEIYFLRSQLNKTS